MPRSRALGHPRRSRGLTGWSRTLGVALNAVRCALACTLAPSSLGFTWPAVAVVSRTYFTASSRRTAGSPRTAGAASDRSPHGPRRAIAHTLFIAIA